MSIFKIEDGELVINRPEFALYPNLSYILRRDKDRFKKQAFRELAYIYFIKDPESAVFKYGYNEQEAHEYAISHCKLPDDWIPDDIVEKAKREYEHLCGSVIKEVIRESLISFRNYTKVIKLIRKHIDKILKTAEETDDLSVDEINKLISYSKQLIELGSGVSEIKDRLYASLKAVEKSMDIDDNTDLVRGTTEQIPQSYDPGKDF